MRPKSMILIVISLGCGLVASIGISQVMEGRNTVTPKVETVEVFVAKVDIKVNENITDKMIVLEPWPKDKMPLDVITKKEDLVGRRPRQQIYKGEPLIQAKMIGEGEEDASQRIRPGYRAVSVKVNEEVAVGNLLKPGDTVDVLCFLRRSGDIRQTVMKTILENVRVFAVNSTLDRIQDDNGKTIKARTVTLEVEPSQVELVTLADAIGRIRLSCRRPDDETERTTPGAVPFQLLGETTEVEANESPKLPEWLDNLAQTEPEPEPIQIVSRGNSAFMDILDPNGVRRWEFPADGTGPREVGTGETWHDEEEDTSLVDELETGEGEEFTGG